MAVILSALVVAVSALAIKLFICLISNRSRRALFGLLLLAGVLFLYVASIGPVCWLMMRYERRMYVQAPRGYLPLGTALQHSGNALSALLRWYVKIGAPDGAAGILVPMYNCDTGEEMNWALIWSRKATL